MSWELSLCPKCEVYTVLALNKAQDAIVCSYCNEEIGEPVIY